MRIHEYIGSDPSGRSLHTFSPGDLQLIEEETTDLARAACSDDGLAASVLHEAVYQILLSHFEPLSSSASADVAWPPIATFIWSGAREWSEAERARHRDTLARVPAVESYPSWITDLVRQHRSGPKHPLFDFLATQADYEQLREFFRQESPLDLHFADVIACLAPGTRGRPQAEIARNFWDEMGEGDHLRTHRAMRARMMERLGLADAGSHDVATGMLVEELELANAYFLSAVVRSHRYQLIGMLLAIESMAPGRLARQIAGWRRVGLGDEDLEYLLVHTVVDVAHGEHWMTEVVEPIIAETPEAMSDITLGVLRRLDIAARICDQMMAHLGSSTAASKEISSM
jgi:pyrroloquinoline quinone (PQQ) biosynthesis protein C